MYGHPPLCSVVLQRLAEQASETLQRQGVPDDLYGRDFRTKYSMARHAVSY